MAAKLTNKGIGELVLKLEHKNLWDVGLEYELDKIYKNPRSVKGTVYAYFTKARKDPKKYGLDAKQIETVAVSLSSRALSGNKTLIEQKEADDNRSFPELVLSGRVKAMKLLHAKLDRIARSKKAVDDVNLSTLATTAGILFDKGQIISGEATENVAVLAKIKSDMTPEEAIDAVLRMREANQVDKDRTNKKK